jgi:glycosyltransferase involved in cell wall biosynthesis
MRIGFLWHCTYPWDVRLERMMRVCIAQGHSVSLLAKGKTGSPVDETKDGVRIRRVFGTRSHGASLLGKILGYPLFFNPVWARQARRFFREQNVDLIIVRDLPLAMLAARTGEHLGKPVVLDMAENYPAALLAYRNPLYKPFLLGNAWLPRKYEQLSLRRLDHVLVVADEQRERLVLEGANPAKITLVGNTPEDFFYRSASANGTSNGSSSGAGGKDLLELLFVGMLDPHRGIHLVIQAMPDLVAEFPNLRLTLAGNGTERERLIGLAESLGVAKNVEFPGWVEFRQVPEYIRRSAICLIPHLRSEHTETTLPNKLFDYMAFGKPVVASDCKPIRRVIEETGCGLTFRSGDVEDLKQALRKMLSDSHRAAMGKKGMRAVAEKYNWNVDERVFVNTIQKFSASAAAS